AAARRLCIYTLSLHDALPIWKPWSELENVRGTNVRNFEDMMPDFADMLAYFSVYPDKFIDYLLPEDSTFQLYPFQRIFLRVMARDRKSTRLNSSHVKSSYAVF